MSEKSHRFFGNVGEKGKNAMSAAFLTAHTMEDLLLFTGYDELSHSSNRAIGLASLSLACYGLQQVAGRAVSRLYFDGSPIIGELSNPATPNGLTKEDKIAQSKVYWPYISLGGLPVGIIHRHNSLKNYNARFDRKVSVKMNRAINDASLGFTLTVSALGAIRWWVESSSEKLISEINSGVNTVLDPKISVPIVGAYLLNEWRKKRNNDRLYLNIRIGTPEYANYSKSLDRLANRKPSSSQVLKPTQKESSFLGSEFSDAGDGVHFRDAEHEVIMPTKQGKETRMKRLFGPTPSEITPDQIPNMTDMKVKPRMRIMPPKMPVNGSIAMQSEQKSVTFTHTDTS